MPTALTLDIGAYRYGIDTDFNGDGFVDGDDFDLFAGCGSGPAVALGAGCFPFDLDFDDDVDQSDFGILQGCLSGTGVLADPACVE